MKKIQFLAAFLIAVGMAVIAAAQTAQPPLTGNAGEISTFHDDVTRFAGNLHEGFRFAPGGELTDIRHVGHFEGQTTNNSRGFQYQVNQLSSGVVCYYCAGIVDFTTVLKNGDQPRTVWNCKIATAASMVTVPISKTKNTSEHGEGLVAFGCRSGSTFLQDRLKETR